MPWQQKRLTHTGTYLISAALMIQGGSPPHLFPSLKGNLPTPCHMLRIEVNPPDAANRIMLEVNSLTDPNEMCAELLKPFEMNIDLGGFPAGHYSIDVNGRQVGEFDA